MRRGGDSNPEDFHPNPLSPDGLQTLGSRESVNRQYLPDLPRQSVATLDIRLHAIIQTWASLAEGERDHIHQLALSNGRDKRPAFNELDLWQVARGCREIIQGCLREEEWSDADLEFFRTIRSAFLGRRDKSDLFSRNRNSGLDGSRFGVLRWTPLRIPLNVREVPWCWIFFNRTIPRWMVCNDCRHE